MFGFIPLSLSISIFKSMISLVEREVFSKVKLKWFHCGRGIVKGRVERACGTFWNYIGNGLSFCTKAQQIKINVEFAFLIIKHNLRMRDFHFSMSVMLIITL